ncbi:hypothetical protein TIFTF001_031971 [Ficus carica]|uniref:beta-galactosidase n=1 Tax=Ficus carica TaxID=3494 RepID=A0AA88DW07_FICCA|nr:hypothetical protein TIFTF001_031971 [Ficus carica]
MEAERAWIWLPWLLLWLTVQLAVVDGKFFTPFNVSYDHRALIIDGKRRMLNSAGIHYPRATPEMWPDLIAKSKEGGADVIQTYVFWNGHEPVRGQVPLLIFGSSSGWLVGSSGLYLHLRIGPYVCAEWNFGGFPVWLRDIPGIEFRTDNAPFKEEMQRFVKKIVDLMREEKLFSWQGGPIIMLQVISSYNLSIYNTDLDCVIQMKSAQFFEFEVANAEQNILLFGYCYFRMLGLGKIENEYGNIEGSFGQKGKEYVKWAANMALGLGAGVPWVMCRQTDAPGEIIDACNAYYCDGYKPNSYNKPTLWTEDWDGWYASWGGRLPHRPVEDLAFAVARFFQRGGSFQNYYMYIPLLEKSSTWFQYFGGTNFGRSAGGPFYITSYDYDAPIDEYGLLNEPKWGHLKDLHAAIKLCEPALVAANSPQYIKLGPQQEAHVYHESTHADNLNFSIYRSESRCSAFLANIDEHSSAAVTFLGEKYTLPPWSVSILPDCKNTVFNTAKVGAQTSIKMVELGLPLSSGVSLNQRFTTKNNGCHATKSWMTIKEPIGVWSETNFTVQGILEHVNVTKDSSDYLWYITRIYISDEDISFWEENNIGPAVKIDSMRDVLRVFVNGELAGSVIGRWVKVSQPVKFVQGYNELLLLSQTVGLQNYGAFLERDGAGFRGQIKLVGFRNGDIDLSKSLWTYQVLNGFYLLSSNLIHYKILLSDRRTKNYRRKTSDPPEASNSTGQIITNMLPVGLKGEFLKVYAGEETEKAGWTDYTSEADPSIFTWYKTYFDTPAGTDPVALDLGSMGKGQAWVNGHHIGRYWTLVAPKDGCRVCDYRGAYNSDKCEFNCGKPTQTWYHVPRSWLKDEDNLLVIFEETGGNPLDISIKLRAARLICSQVSESHYPPVHKWSISSSFDGKLSLNDLTPEMNLRCQDGYVISSIEFASYGTPHGSCQEFFIGKCHASNSSSVVSEACLGRNNCSIRVSNLVFGDPCRGVVKTLAVGARCIPSSNAGSALF